MCNVINLKKVSAVIFLANYLGKNKNMHKLENLQPFYAYLTIFYLTWPQDMSAYGNDAASFQSV